ncbi:cytochrome P450 family protein [Dactylosporangium sp. CA-233914]|uniref:cytochrome P450 family protein n=1 Tax=Dactylosporangium sp. CA-233914 TaxID=3239934 RepID=UPI003D89E25F
MSIDSTHALLRDPHSAYAALRRSAPAHRVTLPDGAQVWLLTRYHDVRAGLADPRLSLDKRHAEGSWRGFALPPRLDANLLNMDAPDHTRLRRLAAQAFTARRVEALRPRVDALAAQLLDQHGDAATIELIGQYAAPLSIAVISELLGVPPADQRQLRAWTNALANPAPEHRRAAGEAVLAIERFLVELIRHKRANPGDDLMTSMITARDRDDRLSEDELTALAFLTIFAGYENATNLIANCIFLLLRHPAALRQVRDSPDRLRAAVEETLRYEPPAPVSIRRFTRENLPVADVVVPARSTVLLGLAAANRDPDVFEEPDSFQIRPDAPPHVSLGFGPHHCLGAALARLEAEVAVGTLLDRYARLDIDASDGHPAWRPSLRTRTLTALPVSAHT